MNKPPATTGALLATVVSVALISSAHAGVTVEQFGEDIARSMQTGDADRFTDALDKKVLIDRTIDGLQGSDEFVMGVREGLGEALSQAGTVLTSNLGSGASLTYLRVRTLDGVTRVLVRLDLGERGLNYLDFFVHERPDGSWGIFDWVDYAQGQTYTNSLRMAVALMAPKNTGLLGRLLGLSHFDTKLANKIAELGNLGQHGDWNGWLRVYRSLPEEARNSRVLLTTRVFAASASGNDDEYMNAMADLHAHHGDDPTLSLTLVDYHLLRGDHDSAYRAVDLMDEYIGGDAGLTNLRAGIALDEQENNEAIRYALYAIKQDAFYESSYWNLMVAGSRAGHYRAAMVGVRGLETRFGYAFSEAELRESGEFGGLLASREWQSGR